MDTPLIRPNLLKRRLADGKAALGTFLIELRQPSVTQLLANCGFDFVVIDNEHGVFSIETIADLSRAARQLELTPVVRIPDHGYPYIAQALDAGAQGIMVPRVDNPAQLESIVRMMKYPPLGMRGNAQGLGYMEFRSGPAAEVLARVNEETLLIVQIETRGAVETLDRLLEVRGVDAALVGPNDLSIALGVPGQTDGPEVRGVIERVIQAGRRTGVAPALHLRDPRTGPEWLRRGIRLLSCMSETGLLMQAGSDVVRLMRQQPSG